METMHADEGGGSENDGKIGTNLGDDNYILDHLRTDDHLFG